MSDQEAARFCHASGHDFGTAAARCAHGISRRIRRAPTMIRPTGIGRNAAIDIATSRIFGTIAATFSESWQIARRPSKGRYRRSARQTKTLERMNLACPGTDWNCLQPGHRRLLAAAQNGPCRATKTSNSPARADPRRPRMNMEAAKRSRYAGLQYRGPAHRTVRCLAAHVAKAHHV